MHTLITAFAKYAILIPVLVYAIVFARQNKQQRVDLVALTVVSALVAIFLVKLATSVHQDPRPFVSDGVKPYFASSTDNGFPSDHTVFSTLIAFVILVYSRKLGLALVLVAILVGTSRVISGVHHGQDVVGGIIIAACSVGLALLGIGAIRKFNTSKTGQP